MPDNDEQEGESLPAARPRSKPLFSVDDLKAEFQAYSRDPFTEVLAHLVACVPDRKFIELFAEEHPDKWAATVKTMAQLAGFHDKLEIEGNINIDIAQMGDTQLMAKMEELTERLKSMDLSPVVDITPDEG